MGTFIPNSPCLDFSGVPPGASPISIHRTGKDVMPFRQGVVVTSYMADFIPPSLMPGYMGHIPRISNTFGNTFGGATKKYYQDYRNEILTSSLRPKFVFGRLPCDFSPFPDVALAEKVMTWRKLSDIPNIRPANIDHNRFRELQRFHEQCQNQREYYMDKTDSVPPDPYFVLGRPYPVRCPVDERNFKISSSQDSCDVPGFVGSPMRCARMPCLQHQALLKPTELPKLPRVPFMCDRVKSKKL